MKQQQKESSPMKVIHRMASVVNGTKRPIYMGLALAGALMFLRANALAAPSGTSSVHYTFKSALTNTGVDADAKGSVNGSLTRQGNVTNQHLTVSLVKLDSNTTYQLVAFIGDDVNSTNVAVLTTNKKGAVKATYVKKANGSPTLPGALDPLTNVRELDIVNGNTQTVLQVNLTNSTVKLAYVFKSPLHSTGFITNAVGSLQINATATTAKFRLTASHLTPNTAYVLTMNGNAVQTNATDHAGKLKLTTLPPGAPDVLDIQTVALTDSSGTNIVLTVSGGLAIPTVGHSSVALGTASTFA